MISTSTTTLRGRAARRTGRYTVLVPVGRPDAGPGLLSLAETLVPMGMDGDVRPMHAATGEHFATAHESAADALGQLLAKGPRSQSRLEPLVRENADVAGAIVGAAESVDAELIVMGWQRPKLSRTLIGGTVARVMQKSKAEIVVHYDRHPRPWKKLLVPYLYGDHDRAAVGVAQRLAQREAESVTILHVVEPHEEPAHVGRFRESVDGTWCEVRVVAAADPMRAAVDEARDGGYDAIVVGTSRAWGLAPAFLGIRHEQLAKETDASMLIVRAARK